MDRSFTLRLNRYSVEYQYSSSKNLLNLINITKVTQINEYREENLKKNFIAKRSVSDTLNNSL